MRGADALAIDHIALAEVRLLREAQQGNSTALRALLEPHADRLWSISAAMLTETDALVAIGSFQERLRHEVRRFAVDQSFAVQLYAALWAHLARRTAATPPERKRPQAAGDPGGPTHAALQRLDPFTRLVFVFQLLTGLPPARLAELVGVEEAVLRSERARALGHLHGGAFPDDAACLAAADLAEAAAVPVDAQLVEALGATRQRASDDLFARAPRGLLDLVQAPEPSIARPAPAARWPALLLGLALVFGSVLAWWAWPRTTDVAPFVEAHAVIRAPGVWLDPSDAKALADAGDHAGLPAPLWSIPDLTGLDLWPVGAVLRPNDRVASTVIYEDDSGAALTWQRWGGTAPPELAHTTQIAGRTLRHTHVDGLSMVAYSANGVVHLVAAEQPEARLVALVERRLTAGSRGR